MIAGVTYPFHKGKEATMTKIAESPLQHNPEPISEELSVLDVHLPEND